MNNTHPLKYGRIQGRETAYRTGKPVGIFAAVWRLEQAGILTDDEKAIYHEIDNVWFQENLPNPPFYEDNKPGKPITWFETSTSGFMIEKLQPLNEILKKVGLMILQNSNCMDDTLQRQYLSYIWNRKDGIYYLANFPLSEKINLEDKRFYLWIYTLEFLTGFSLFPEFMKEDALPHLLSETYRLINEDVVLPTSYNLRYSNSWRDKNNRKTDLVLRLARILQKC